MTREQLIGTIGKNGKRLQLRGSDLAKFDFSGLDLTGADLSFSNLGRANFRGAVLRNADLSFSNLIGADFSDADLYEANFNFCALQNVNLDGANVEGATFNFAGRSAYRPDTHHREPITLTAILQKPGWGLLIGCILGALLVYGASSIIFFTNLILTSNDPAEAGLNRFVAIQNLALGVTLFLCTWTLSLWLDRTFRAFWLRHLLFSLVITPVLAMVSGTTYILLGQRFVEELNSRPNYTFDEAGPGYVYLTAYLLIGNLLLYTLRQGRQLSRKMSEQEFQLLNMEKLKTRAELDALQAKINPHFLYNALNSIASLVHDNPDKAEEMTLLLSKLFRYSTGRDGDLFATLADELEMVRTYLQVEQVRFGNRLTFSVEVSDPNLIDLKLPQFLLQPIVENAIKHGIAKRADAGRIDVRIYEKARDRTAKRPAAGPAEPTELHLCVHDNGPAFPDEMSGGYGLRSIQDKLKLLYGDDARVELQNWPLKQVLLSIRMERLLMMNDK